MNLALVWNVLSWFPSCFILTRREYSHDIALFAHFIFSALTYKHRLVIKYLFNICVLCVCVYSLMDRM